MTFLAAAALLAADLMVIGGFLAWGWRRLDSVRRMAVDWAGQPERRDPTGTVIDPARPGVPGRLVRLEGKLAAIDKELHPNGGGSFRDIVSHDLAGLHAAIGRVEQEQARLRSLVERPPERSTIEAGGIGFQADIAV